MHEIMNRNYNCLGYWNLRVLRHSHHLYRPNCLLVRPKDKRELFSS